MSDAGLQHFLGSAVINRQGLLELRHSDVSHHAVAGEVEELHVLGVGGFGVHRAGKGAGDAGAFLGESGVVGVRGGLCMGVVFRLQRTDRRAFLAQR